MGFKIKDHKRPWREPPVNHYFLTPDELEKYRAMKPPINDARLRITAPRTKPGKRGR